MEVAGMESIWPWQLREVTCKLSTMVARGLEARIKRLLSGRNTLRKYIANALAE